MAAKAIVFLVLFMATFILISSDVAGRELAETTDATKPETDQFRYGNTGGYQNRGGYGGYGNGGCPYGYCAHAYRCCYFAGENMAANAQAKPEN